MTYSPAKRLLSQRLPSSDKRRLAVLTGARQVGKTTLARAASSDLRYVNLDAVEDRAALAALPAREWGATVGRAILDEAQKEPAVFEKLKFAYDAGDVDFTALLGSAQIILLQQVRETLAGRVLLYELWPLCLSELAASGDEPHASLFAALVSSPRPVDVLKDTPSVLLADREDGAVMAARHLATWGGMPALLHLAADERRDWLRSCHDTYLQRDLGDLVRLRDLAAFHRFQRLAALRSGTVLGYADLARDAGTSPATARNCLEYLRLSYQAFLLQPFASSTMTGLVKAPKLFRADLGVVRYLAGSWGPAPGALFETLVVAEAVKLIRTLSLDAEPRHYRTRSGAEIDLLVETPDGVLAFEAKARAGRASADFRTMRHLAGA
ncbi:MAG: ATP-binding protein, partial [Actinobacteria bacterium]|nr:ATP-binding protein [Actinomycetota bacterium]